MTNEDVISVLACAVISLHRQLEAPMTPADAQRFADLRTLVDAQLRRSDDVLTIRLQLLQIDVHRLEHEIRHVGEQLRDLRARLNGDTH